MRFPNIKTTTAGMVRQKERKLNCSNEVMKCMLIISTYIISQVDHKWLSIYAELDYHQAVQVSFDIVLVTRSPDNSALSLFWLVLFK